ncbi:MAG: family 16 glycoside hydrolase [Candidatus Cyclobacteriaceae bacterium M3_2C_046]
MQHVKLMVHGKACQSGLSLFLLLIFSSSLWAQQVYFRDDVWKVMNVENNQETAKQITDQEGIEALLLPANHIAWYKGQYQNFTIEFDLKGGAMPGLGFRAQDLYNFEYFYVRMMNSGKPTALQYFPVYQGADAWQIYNYPKYESQAEFPADQWMKVILKVYGDNLQVFIGDSESPNLSCKLLHSGADQGNLFLRSSFQDTHFANVSVRELEQPFSIREEKTSHKYLVRWMLSPQFEASFHSQSEVYANYKKMADQEWIQIEADRNGIVNLARHYDIPQNVVFAKTIIEAEQDKSVELLFDYTLSLMVALNNEILFCGTELDTRNFMRVIDGEERLTLPLKQGQNELVFMVQADDLWQEAVQNPLHLGQRQAMNWGFIARLNDYDGISLK